MWHVYRKMYSREKDLVEDHIEKKRDKLCKEQEVKIRGKNIRTEEISIGEIKLD